MLPNLKRSMTAPALLLCALIVIGGVTLSSSALGSGDPDSSSQKDEKKSKKSRKPKKSSKSSSDDIEMKDVPADEKLEKKLIAELPESMREGFKVKRTLHYSILYDTSEEDVAVFGHAIERTYRSCVRFCQKLDIDVHQPEEKMVSYFFNEFKDYSSFGGKVQGGSELSPNLLGFYMPDTNFTYFYNFRNTPAFKSARDQAESELARLGEQARSTKDSTQRRNLARQMDRARFVINRSKSFGGGVTEETLQHEVAHQVLFNIGFHNKKNPGANPRWFAEGMAQLFEPVSTDKGGNMGIVNKDKAEAFQNLVQIDRLYPLKDFIKDIRPFVSGNVGGISYPQSWGLAHYITRTKRKELRKFVQIILKRSKSYKSSPEDEIATFEECFGKIDRKWERRWKSWMKNVR